MPTLLEPFKLHDLPLSNRVVMAPLTRSRSGPTRIPNALMAEYYAQRASVGLIITEATVVSEIGIGWSDTPGIYTPAMVDGWKQVVEAVHSKGSKIFLQLWHTGRASHSSFHPGQLPVAPSAIKLNGDYIHTPNGKQSYETPHALTIEEVWRTVEDYAHGAKGALEAGFDGVEIHGANGYLIDEFLQSKTNQRDDDFGGSIEKRFRFLDEIVKATLKIWPSHRVGVRLSPNGVFNDMGSADYREQFSYVAQQLDHYNLAYIHVMDGLAFGFHGLGEPMTLREFRQWFHNPLMGNCGYNFQDANSAVQAGDADLIAFGRPIISNPDLVERFKHGWPLAPEADIKDWYTPAGAEGYTSFPKYEAAF